MNGNIEKLREDLWLNVSGIAASFDRFNFLIYESESNDEAQLRERLGQIEDGAEQNRARTIAAHSEFERWMDEERNESAERLAEWKQKRQSGQLHARADRCERCAAVAVEIALLAMDQAEMIIVRALLARTEAISVQIQRGDKAGT
ncbi:hypothetical protein [Bradyrhizobium sp. dw_411]|uniref:hypothetical protein n=1 Tax=Bradyrhizobium sp. dw_411 TaxID=2720082 RepID=UPI001BCD37FF|nr:hypothetical protein [Bradyrhizobium sp. dw_411]